MIVALADQLRELLLGVIRECGAGADVIDERYFGPYDQPIAIGQIIEILRMLVVAAANGVGAHFPNQPHILVMLRVGDGPAAIEAILVAIDAV